MVDDGSQDKTVEIVKGFKDKVRLIVQKNAGASAARNAGIRAARHEWIAFLDGDDEWLPEKLQKQVDFMQKHPDICWISSNYWRCDCKSEQRYENQNVEKAAAALNGREYFDSFFTAYQNNCYGWTGTMLIQKDLCIKAGLFTEGLARCNDIDMWFKIAYDSPKIGYINEPLAVYHMGVPDSIIKKHRDPEIVCELVRRHFELAKQKGVYKEFKSCSRIILGVWITLLLTANDGKSVRAILREFDDVFSSYFKKTVTIKSFFPKLGLWYDQMKKNFIDKSADFRKKHP